MGIIDASEFLAGLVAVYKASVDAAYSALDASASSAESIAREGAGQLGNAFSGYLDTIPISLYVDGTNFRKLISDAKDKALGATNVAANEISVGYTTRLGNAQIDYGYSLTAAGDSYSRSINTADIDDPEWDTKYAAANADIESYVTAKNLDATTRLTASSDTVQALINVSTSDLSTLFNKWVLNRPLLRYTGRYSIPVVKLDAINDYSCEVTDIGAKSWYGWMGIKLKDEYYKTFTSSVIQSITKVDPGQTGLIRMSVYVPSIMIVDGQPRSLGKKIKATIQINTRLE